MVASTILCNNILERGFKEKVSISPMKLQKLMYFTCSEYMKRTGNPLITENFSVWKYGPVLVSVYNEFKHYHSSPIKEYAKDSECKSYKINESENPNLNKVLNDVWFTFKEEDGVALSQITHKEGSAWSKAFEEGKQLLNDEDIKNDGTYQLRRQN